VPCDHVSCARQLVMILNEALACDQAAVSALVEHRVLCNDVLAEHPDIPLDGNGRVGLLGLLNGVAFREGEVIEALYSEDDLDTVTGFRLRPRPAHIPG
jgi:hypothetical protein